MNLDEVKRCVEVLDLRERVIVKLAIIVGMRPGEIFGLTWERLSENCVEIVQRVYRGKIDTPKTNHSVRRAALPAGLRADMAMWRWRRNILPRLSTVRLEWANFQVMRLTHASIMKQLGVDPKWVADQLGHSLDVSQNIYTQVPVEQRLEALHQLEKALGDVNGAQMEHRREREFPKLLI